MTLAIEANAALPQSKGSSHDTNTLNRGNINVKTQQKENVVLGDKPLGSFRPLKVVVIGAGLSGVLAGALLPAKVPGIDLTIYEKNPEVGGTWYENTYPGVRCDIPSHVYQSGFSPNTQWTDEFATGGEILEYWKSVAKKHDVYRHLEFNCKVTKLEWHEEEAKWTVAVKNLQTSQESEVKADFVLTAIGRFNDYRMPNYPGMSEFKGLIRHTSNWDPNFEPTGKKIALIGNGASGVQMLPNLQRIANRVDHYARSKTWITRSWAGDVRTWGPKPFTPEQLESFKDPAVYLAFRKNYEEKYWRRTEGAFRGSQVSINAREDATRIMKERLAKKPEMLENMVPDFSPGCRRPTPGPGYLEALCEDNVSYIQTPISHLTATGIVTTDGTTRDVDAIFCATGHNTDLVPPFPIIARGIDLQSAWKPTGSIGFAKTYFGIAAPDVPNLMFIYGPQAGGLSGSVPNVVETQITMIAKVLRKVASQGIRKIAPSKGATEEFAEYSEAFYRGTVLTDQCSSWYNGGVKGGRVTGLWPGSSDHLTLARKEMRWEDWEYEHFTCNRYAYFGNGLTVRDHDPTSDITSFLQLPGGSLRDVHE